VLDLVLVLLLTSHLLCVNVAAGGPLVAAWLDWRGMRGDDAAARAAVDLARASLLGLLIGAGLGLLLGWVKWDATYRSLWLGPLSYKLHWAGIEALFSLVLMLGWWLWLPGRSGGSGRAMATRGLIAVLASTNLLYHFPPLFSVAARLQRGSDTVFERIGGAEFRKLMTSGETPALSIHVALASLAVAGAVLLLFAMLSRKTENTLDQARLARGGAWWALVPSLCQLPVGLWTLVMLPADSQAQLMGGSTLGIFLFIAAIAAALWLLNELAHIAMGEASRPLQRRAIAAMLVTVLLMTALQQQTRILQP
jgi:hypothetical protein